MNANGPGSKRLSGLFALGRDFEDDVLDEPVIRNRSSNASAVVVAAEIPDRLAVPAFPVDCDGFARLEIQLIHSGQSLLAFGFTSRELLSERLGEWQPWIGMPGARLVELLDRSEVDGLVIDPAPEIATPLWTREALEALRKVNDVRI